MMNTKSGAQRAADASPAAPSRLPKVLILLATYNGAPWLREQFESILAQRNVDVRVLVGDDRSTDDTLALLDEWRADPRVAVHAWDNSSGSAGANFRRLYAAADLAGIDYVALADQDDIWGSGKLDAAIAALGRGQANGYSCAVRAFWPDGRQKVLKQHAGIRAADFLFEGAGQGCTFVVTAALFQRVQLICREAPQLVGALHYHDWLIYLLDRAWHGRWVFDRADYMLYRQHGGNEIGARGGLAPVLHRLGKIRNGWYLGQVRAALAVYTHAGGSDPIVRSLGALLDAAPSLRRNLGLMVWVARHGRRSVTDRCILAISALAGWI